MKTNIIVICINVEVRQLSSFAINILYSEVSKSLNISKKELTIERNDYGKPYFKNFPNIHFNISHTKGAVAIVISSEPIGIDIEGIGKAHLGIINRFFTEREKDYIMRDDIDRRFFEVWTRKEAYTKYLGKGLYIPLRSFDVFTDLIYNMSIVKTINNYLLAICGNGIDSNIQVSVRQENHKTVTPQYLIEKDERK